MTLWLILSILTASAERRKENTLQCVEIKIVNIDGQSDILKVPTK